MATKKQVEHEGIRLVSVEGENVRKLSTVAVRLDGKPGVFRVTGENEEGKSTFLDLVAMLFGGKKAVKPDTIQEGKDGAWIKGTLNNGYSIGLKFTASAPDGYLTITTPEDAIQKAPQTLLDGWGGPRSFDPGALLRKKTSQIEAIILGLAKDPDLKGKRTAIEGRRLALLDERTPINSRYQKATRTKLPEGTRPDPVDVSGEMERLEELEAQQAIRNAALRKADDLKARSENLDSTARRKDEEVADLRARLDAAEAMAGNLHKEAASFMADASKQNEDACALPYVDDAIEAVRTHISDADTINEELEPWREYDRAQVDMREAGDEAGKITKQIKTLDAKEEALLKAAEIPVRGISFGEDGGMLLDGHPIEVNSGMRKLDMAYDIGVAADSQIKICLMDEANDYGLAALKMLRTRAEGDGVQVLAARLLDTEGHGEIMVEDGRAWNQEPETT